MINIPTVEMAEKVVACGNVSGANTDKFVAFGFAAMPASQVSPPLITECYANLECRAVDTEMAVSYCLFILEVVQAWIDPAVIHPRTIHHMGRGNFMVAGEIIRLKSKMK